VCLHCRHAERIAAGERRKKLMLRGTAAAIVVALVAGTTLASASALRGRFASKNDTIVKVVSSTPVPQPSPAATPASAPASAASPQQSGDVTQRPPVAPAVAMVPVIPPGETMLRDSVLAYRTDSAVVVSFDRPMTRTRRPEKFEAFLRATLGQIYGATADSALARMPQGTLASQGDLLNDLPTRGIRSPVSEAWKLAVYPELRPGQDGPLVIRYRVAVSAASDQR
jgi:hypothetical protein